MNYDKFNIDDSLVSEQCQTIEDNSPKNIELYDNTWKRWFRIKIIHILNYLKGISPVFFFVMVSYAGTKTANMIFKKYIKHRLDGKIEYSV